MYDVTYNEILERMLSRVSDKFDKREGSVIFDTHSPTAFELEILYVELNTLIAEAYGDSASREFLIKRCKERGITPYEATYAVLKGEFTPANIDVAKLIGGATAMIYASEADYKEYLSGREAVINTAFLFYARQASQIIQQYTFNNIDENNIPAEVKMCCCEIAENLYRSELVDKKSGGASSEAVAGWSKSYESAESRKNALDKAVRDCIYKWLGDTGLLYSGAKRC